MTRDSIDVRINRRASEALDPAASAIEREGSFDLVFHAEHMPTHVHCRLEDGLERVATIDEPNVYVDADTETVVPVRVKRFESPAEINGRIELATNFGADTTSIDVTITSSDTRIAVDESLATPPAREPKPPSHPSRDLLDQLGPDTLGVLALAVVAVVLGFATAFLTGGLVAVIGFLVILAGVLVGLYYLLV